MTQQPVRRDEVANFVVVPDGDGFSVLSHGLDGKGEGIVSLRPMAKRTDAVRWANKWNWNLGFAKTV